MTNKIKCVLGTIAIGIIIGLAIPHAIPAISDMLEREVCYGKYIVLQYRNGAEHEIVLNDLKALVVRGQYYNRVKDRILWTNDFKEYNSDSDSSYLQAVDEKFQAMKGGSK